ncbi:CBS domain-containing protein [Nocardioides sp.]|uniref:CBS domain-containing protein n=1 Tax=Nocardioides sp. TaxID=35761 RepID=UPI002614C41A|nr:CBS domain-containing protein [Nocardioides sp.]
MKGPTMLVLEVMSSPVVTVRTDASLKAAIALLERHDVSAMPVVNMDGQIVGVVSEADVIRELVVPDQRTFESPVPMTAALFAQSVADVMTTHPITVTPETDLAVATELMTSSAIKSLPVVDQGRVVGMVSRRDVIRVLAKPDELIEGEIDDLFRQVGHDWLVDVTDGLVAVDGPTGASEQRLAEALARTVPGVVALRFERGPI